MESLKNKPMITGFGGVITQVKEDDVTIDDNFILRQGDADEWWIWQLITPKFRIGDCIRAKCTTGDGAVVRKIDYKAGCYVFDHNVKGSYVSMEYELVPYEPKHGDIVRKKDDKQSLYRISTNLEGLPGQGEFYIMKMMEHGASGGYITKAELKRDYELVERYKPLEKVVENFGQDVKKALAEDFVSPVAMEVEITLDGVRHRLVNNPDAEGCHLCSLDKVCDRFKDAICNVFAGHYLSHIFEKVEEGKENDV